MEQQSREEVLSSPLYLTAIALLSGAGSSHDACVAFAAGSPLSRAIYSHLHSHYRI